MDMLRVCGHMDDVRALAFQSERMSTD
jgi:hypothetical protein